MASMSDQTVSRVLRQAAQRVREGWCQNAYGIGNNVCALGAIGRSTREPMDLHFFWGALALDAAAILGDYLGLEIEEVAAWNDEPGRTAEEVAATMERAADQYDAEHPPTVAWTHRELVTT